MATPVRVLPLRPPLAPPPGIPVFSLKVSASIAGNDMPRIVPAGADDKRAVELRLQVPGGPGRPGELLTAIIPAKTYLKHQALIERYDGACTALLQGRVVRAGELVDAALTIQPASQTRPAGQSAATA